ncbi:MAG: pilus assembly PilX N-terminal domain-containing protein [Pseudomonadota bacterium]
MRATRNRQRGSALIVSMIFLIILTILGISTMSTSRLELKMANNNQLAATAFQLAESGIESTLDIVADDMQNLPQNENDTPYTPAAFAQTAGSAATSTSYIMDSNIVAGNSINNSTALHYRMTSTSSVAGGGEAQHVQGFYIVAPSQN